MAGQWAYEGDAAVQKTQQHDATMALQLELRKMQLREFYLKAGESTQLLFLDDFKFFYYRHLIPNGRGGFDPVTCLSELGDCPLCKAGKAKQWVGCATVIDLRRSFESTKNPGKAYKFQKYILAAGQEGRNRLLHLGEKHNPTGKPGGSLKFCVLDFAKAAAGKSASIGGNIDFTAKRDMEYIKKFAAQLLIPALTAYANKEGVAPSAKEWLSPVDYYKAFAPLEPAKLAQLAGVAFTGAGGATPKAAGMLDDLDGLDGLGGYGGQDLLNTMGGPVSLDSGFDGGAGDDLLGGGATTATASANSFEEDFLDL